MADRSTGPVKPPVIDLTPRASSPRPDETAPDRDAAEPAGARFSLAGASWPLLGGTALAGALLGTVLTYLLATALPLPVRLPETPDLGPELADQATRLEALSANLAGLTATATRTQVSLDATIAQLDAGLAAADKAIAEARAAIPAPVDLAPLEAELKTLSAQVDAIAAGASGADASAIARSLADLETQITSAATRLSGVDQTLASLRTDLDAARQTLSAHIESALPNEVGPALKLPLILSGLEGAFASGKPFRSELVALRAVLPDFVVPEGLDAAADKGISRPDAVLARFEAALPDILAARDSTGSDWVESAIDWTKSLLALRPAEEVEGDSPEAVVSRLEAAMERRDYQGALALIEQLPAGMRDAAALASSDIRVHAEADGLVADLRARALASADAP